MTPFAIVVGCLAFVMIAGVSRRRPGAAVTDLVVMVGLLALIGVADLILGRFVDTGDSGWTVAALLAAAFALNALYGLMAPERQLRRDRQLRRFLRGKRA